MHSNCLPNYRPNNSVLLFWNLTDQSSEMNSNKICGARIHCHVFEFVIYHLHYILKFPYRLAFKLRIKCFEFSKTQSSAFRQGGLQVVVWNVNQISFFRIRGCMYVYIVNPLNAELNPICHLLALLGTYLILYVSRIRVKPSLKAFTTVRRTNVGSVWKIKCP